MTTWLPARLQSLLDHRFGFANFLYRNMIDAAVKQGCSKGIQGIDAG
jgi:hypothetical protein